MIPDPRYFNKVKREEFFKAHGTAGIESAIMLLDSIASVSPEYKKLVMKKRGMMNVSIMIQSKPDDRRICNAGATLMPRMLSV